jgi:MFS family permease
MTLHAPALEDGLPEAQEPSAAQSAAQPWPSSGTAWKTLWILSIVLGLSQVDRNILSLLLQMIKHDLKLSDTQMGVLIGFAFSCLYLFLSFPLSWVADRKSRKALIALGVAFWSLSTAACGLATSFLSMFWARAGVGAGEAANGPATYSLLADSFPREKLPRAMAILNLGFVGGTAISMILGGLVIGALVHMHVVLPLLGAMRTWQLVFFAVGLPGLLVAALVMTITEPARRGSQAGQAGEPQSLAVKIKSALQVFPFLFQNGRFYGCMFLSIFVTGVVSSGTLQFRPAFFQRTYHWPAQQYGVVSGIVSLITSPIGLLAGTWLCERWNRKHNDGNMRVALFAYVISIPFAVAGPLMPNPWLSVACGAAGGAVVLMAAPPLVAAMQSITPGNVRSQVNSLYLLLFSGITGIIGPAFIGWLTDLQHDENKLYLVMAVSSAIALPISVMIMAGALKPFGQMIGQIKRDEAAAASS